MTEPRGVGGLREGVGAAGAVWVVGERRPEMPVLRDPPPVRRADGAAGQGWAWVHLEVPSEARGDEVGTAGGRRGFPQLCLSSSASLGVERKGCEQGKGRANTFPQAWKLGWQVVMDWTRGAPGGRAGGCSHAGHPWCGATPSCHARVCSCVSALHGPRPSPPASRQRPGRYCQHLCEQSLWHGHADSKHGHWSCFLRATAETESVSVGSVNCLHPRTRMLTIKTPGRKALPGGSRKGEELLG